MKILGITGGVGAGKSTVLDFLRTEFKAQVMEADKVGHFVMEPGQSCYEPVIALFGKQVIKNDKTIDRRMVSDVVFGNDDLRRKLEAVIHPAVKEYILHEISLAKQRNEKLFVVEAALFLEEHYEEFCDKVWYIHTDKEIRIKRLMESRGYTREKAESIIAGQASEEYFSSHTDARIVNNSDLSETYRQIREELEKL